MDEAKKPKMDETHSPNEQEDIENKAKYSDILTEEDTLSTSQLSSSELTPKFNESCEERTDLPSHLKDEEILHEGSIQGTSKNRIDQDNDASSENQTSSAAFRTKLKPIRKGKKGIRKKRLEVDKVKSLQSESNEERNSAEVQEDSEISSEKKVNNFKNTVSKYLRRALRRPMGTVRNLIFYRNKGKKPKTSESRSNEKLALTKYLPRMDNPQRISNEDVSGVKLETLGDSKTEILNIEKEKGKSEALAKLRMHHVTSTKSKDETLSLSSTNSTSKSEKQSDTNLEKQSDTNLEKQSDTNLEKQSDTNSEKQSEIKTVSSKVKSSEAVLGHFKKFMQSKTNTSYSFKSEENTHEDEFSESRIRPLDEFKETATESASRNLDHSEDSASNLAIQNLIQNLKDLAINKPNSIMTEKSRNVTNSEVSSTQNVSFKSQEDKKIFPESRIRPLDEFKETATESASRNLDHSVDSASNLAIQNLNDLAEENPNLRMTENSRNATNREVSSTQIENSKTLVKDIPRQRIVYDERYEYIRGWVAAQIKDKGQCLKLKIKEGEYSDDIETKMRCIEEAEDIQEETDNFLDELDEYDRMDNNPIGFVYSTRDDYSISPAPRRKDLRWPEGDLRSLLDLFNYLYKFSNSKSKLEKVYQSIHRVMLKMDYDIHVATMREKDADSDVKAMEGRDAVDDFCLELIECRPKVKKEIPHTEIRSSDDYMNYVQQLIIAAKENLACLHNVIEELSPMIIPLHIYLSQAYKKFVRTYSFLKEERSDIFFECYDEDTLYF